MAMFAQWNWWLPRWLDRILPSVDFEKPLPKADIGDLVIIPEDISTLGPSGADIRTVVRSAAKLKSLAPQTITVADPLAFKGCGPAAALGEHVKVNGNPRNGTNGAHGTNGTNGTNGAHTNGSNGALATNGTSRTRKLRQPIHPVTVWRGRLSVALDALSTAAALDPPVVRRLSPMETTNVQLPTGDRLQIPTGAETLRLKSYLIMCRNSARDYAEFAELAESMDTQTAAVVLAGMDRYYCGQRSRKQWVATQLVRRLADPHPSDEHGAMAPGAETDEDWARVRQRCLSVAVAMLEEAR
jgi:RND superfamily putative drug exporter